MIGYKCTPPDGLEEVLKSIESFQSLANNGWYGDKLEEQGRVLFKKLGKCFNIKPPVASVDWDSMPNRRGIGC
jgi:hypothetical protein